MTITERTLRQWRREALIDLNNSHSARPTTDIPGEERNVSSLMREEMNRRILRLTQELLDEQLIQVRKR